MMWHWFIRRRLEDYADGVLPESNRRAVENHLAECRDCRDQVEAAAAVRSRLTRSPLPMPAADRWNLLTGRIRAGVAQVERPIRPAPGHRRWAPAGMVAAILIGLSLVLIQTLSTPKPGVEKAVVDPGTVLAELSHGDPDWFETIPEGEWRSEFTDLSAEESEEILLALYASDDHWPDPEYFEHPYAEEPI